MDYRNSIDVLDKNTIIYGHRNKQGLMFGTLKNVLEKKWYTNESNQIITFNTLPSIASLISSISSFIYL